MLTGTQVTSSTPTWALQPGFYLVGHLSQPFGGRWGPHTAGNASQRCEHLEAELCQGCSKGSAGVSWHRWQLQERSRAEFRREPEVLCIPGLGYSVSPALWQPSVAAGAVAPAPGEPGAVAGRAGVAGSPPKHPRLALVTQHYHFIIL